MQSHEEVVFEREDWTHFRTTNGCAMMAGVSADCLGKVVAKELADNGLDADAACQVGMLEGGGFFVHDAGPGLPGDDRQVAERFSVGRPLTSTKLKRLPTRGALGNGLRVVAGVVLASQGALTVQTHGRSLRLTPLDDGTTAYVNLGPWDGRGTCVEVRLGRGLGDAPDLLDWAEQAKELAGGGKAYAGRSSPWWYEDDSFCELLWAGKGRTVRDVVSELHGCGREKASEASGAFLSRRAEGLSREEAAELLDSARRVSDRVRPESLGFVGRLPRFTGYSRRLCGAYSVGPTRPGGHAAEIPYVIEAWAVVSDSPSITVCVNRTPITAPVDLQRQGGDGGADYAVFGCNLHHRFLAGRRRHFRLMVNVISPYLPVMSHGKEPDLQQLRKDILQALAKACRGAKKAAPKKGGKSQIALTHEAIPSAVERVSGGGKSRYSLRQLFYAVRPLLVALLGREPNYDTFVDNVTEYEDRVLHGNDLPGIYRDNRGMLYHPHTGETIALGTRTVEQYRRPAWTFNKILYCEKEGFFPLLMDAGWPERNDCALLTSKGFATRALRDVLDLLAETDEDLWVFTMHDADGPGTMIHEKAQGATRARPARKIRLINIGLEPQEALEMGLEPEPVQRKDGGAVPVASYVKPRWREWLQKNRVELNQMTNPQILEWLDRKLEHYQGKVVPPHEVMTAELAGRVSERLRRRITEDVLRRAELDRQVEDAHRALAATIERRGGSLALAVPRALQDAPKTAWRVPIDQIAGEIVAAWDGTVARAGDEGARP